MEYDMINMIQAKIAEMSKNMQMQDFLMCLMEKGFTDEQIKETIVNMAIATLYGAN